MATNEHAIQSYILAGVVDLIGHALGPVDKLIASIKRIVKNIKPKLDIGATPLKLELTTDTAVDPALAVKEALLLLEQLLSEKKQPAILLFDEFQTVGIIAQGKGIEGAIRHVAQKTKYLTIIFSGSNRKLLSTMFEDDTRPLYKLCWKLSLNRISIEHYQSHIQKAALAAWKSKLSEDALAMIFSMTERHPYYVNKLCDKLWTYYDKPPTASEVKKTWQEILIEEKSDAIKEISALSLGQKNVLLYIASEPASSLTAKDTILQLKMVGSSIITALTALEEKDIIEKDGADYHIINPVIRFYVLQRQL